MNEQVAAAAKEIVRANVEQAKKGSLAHTRWLYSFVERQGEVEPLPADRVEASLADILLQELSKKQ